MFIKMRRLLVILLSLIFSQLFAQNYYVDNTGTGDTLATLAEVNALGGVGPGDTIFLKKGCLWRESLQIPGSGNAGSYAVIMSYGVGAKPKIYGSNQAITWTAEGHTNIWQSATSLTDPYGGSDMEVFFVEPDDSVKWGDQQTHTAGMTNLTAEYDWSWSANTLYVYAASDPDTRYTSVEAPQRYDCIDMEDEQYIKIDGLELAYALSGTGGQGYPTGDLSGYTLSNCKIHHLGINKSASGGGYGSGICYSDMLIEYNEIYDIGRRAISVYNYGNDLITNITIRNNVMYNGSHTVGIDISAGGGPTNYDDGSFRSIYIYGNFVYEDENEDYTLGYRTTSNFMKVENAPTAYMRNLYFYNNIVMYTQGGGIQLEGPDSVYLYNNTFYGVNKKATSNTLLVYIAGATDNVVLKNNIFYGDGVDSVNSSPFCVYLAGPVYTDVDADYNIYYQEDAANQIVRQSSPYVDYFMNTFSTMQSTWGWETNSPNPADPLFINVTDPMELDVDSLMINVLSPAVNAGIGLGYYTTKDYLDSLRDASPDIGAIEYGSTSFDPPDPPSVTTTTPTVIYTRLARAGGTSIDDGGGTISTKGICWSTSANPTTSDSKTACGTGMGVFSGYMDNLQAGATYHCRAYVTNETSTQYGSDLTFTTPVKSYVKTGGKYLKTGGKYVILH